MTDLRRWGLLADGLLLVSVLAGGGACGGDVEFFADNGLDKSVNVIQHPCAEHVSGTTYVAYQGPHEDAYVCGYDHDSKAWRGPVRAGVSALGDTPDPTDGKQVDNHGRPALVVDQEGYVHVMFGGHGGSSELGANRLGLWGSGRQTHAVTKRPGDISSWDILDNVDSFGTYSQFVKMDDGDIYLFYRHGPHCSDWVYQKSVDNCRTFAPPVSVLKYKAQESDSNTRDAWYAWFTKGRGDSIVGMYNYHPCKHVGHTNLRVNAYCMVMNCGDETWRNAAGKPLLIPVTKEAADALTLVHDSGTTKINHGACGMDDTGAPHIYYRHSSGSVCYSRWLGDAWQEPVKVSPEAGSQDGDMLIESPTVVRLLLDGGTPGGGSEVSWWKTTDGGLTWAKESTIVSSDTLHYNVSSFVRNASPPGQIIVQELDPAATDLYRRLFFWGSDGFVGRPEAEARIARGRRPEPSAGQTVRFGTPLGQRGTVAFRVRPDRTYRNGPGAKTATMDLVEIPRVAKIRLQQAPTACELQWIWETDGGVENLKVEIPELPGPEDYFMQFSWDAAAGRFTGYVNGTPLRVPDTQIPPWTAVEAAEARLPAGPVGVIFMSAEPRYLDQDEAQARVPPRLLGVHGDLFGFRTSTPAMLDVAGRLGDVIYESPLDAAANIAGWVMEGPGDVAFEDGWMGMRSERPDGPDGHIVQWCPADVPDRFVADWEMQVQSSEGLCIVFFAAAGLAGEDIFSPSLPPRTGLFPQYNRGAMNCYHISYFANTPSAPGRSTSNMRKNSGFHVVANAPPGIPPGSLSPHAMRLVKDSAQVQLLVDGTVVIDFIDDGQRYGPVLGAGKIGFRQMQWTRARYRNLRVYALRPAAP